MIIWGCLEVAIVSLVEAETEAAVVAILSIFCVRNLNHHFECLMKDVQCYQQLLVISCQLPNWRNIKYLPFYEIHYYKIISRVALKLPISSPVGWEMSPKGLAISINWLFQFENSKNLSKFVDLTDNFESGTGIFLLHAL